MGAYFLHRDPVSQLGHTWITGLRERASDKSCPQILARGSEGVQPLLEKTDLALSTQALQRLHRLPEQNDSCCCLATAHIRPSSPAGHEGSGGTVNKRGMVTPFEGMMPFLER